MESDAVRADSIMGHQGSMSATINVKKYDFKRPDKFSKDQIRTVSIMHETFARLATTNLCAMLRSLVHVHLSAVDQCTYEEFIRLIPNPTTLAVLNMDPLRGSAILEMDPSITFSLINKIFGGLGKEPEYSRDLTDIECSVLEGVVTRVLGNLREAWSTVIDLRPRLGQIETNPMFAQIVPPTEMVILVTLESKIGDTTGFINLCIPYLTIEPIISKLSAQYWYSSVRLRSDVFEDRALRLKAESKILFETEALSLSGINSLKKGSLVKLIAPAAAILEVGGKPIMKFDARNTKNGFVFCPREEAETLTAADGILKSEQRSGHQNIEERRDSSLVKAFADEVGKGFKGITGKIEQLEKRQAELADMFAYGNKKADQALSDSGTEIAGKPFSFVRSYDKEALVSFLAQEHPQTIALITSFLEPGLASGIIASLPEELQPDVAERIATLQRCAPEVIFVVERVLKMKLKLISDEKIAIAGGIESLVDILQVADRKLEKTVIEMLEKKNPELAEEAKKRMFVFEDTTLLDAKVMKLVVERIDRSNLLLALKATDEKTKQHFLAIMDAKTRSDFEADLAKLGPARLSRVEEAQQLIIRTIRSMEESGEIDIARSGEEIVE